MKYLLAWKHLPCLHVGCGNSNIQEGLMDDGFVEVINVGVQHAAIHTALQWFAWAPCLQTNGIACTHASEQSMHLSTFNTAPAHRCGKGNQ